jgi:hypothetical protein
MSMREPIVETRCLSSLSKVFADTELSDQAIRSGSMLLGETYSFQVAYRSSRLITVIQAKIVSELSRFTEVRRVGLVPSELPVYSDHDEDIIRAAPGLFPDPLYSIDPMAGFTAPPNQWRSLWVSVDLQDQNISSGFYPVEIYLETEAGERLAQEHFSLEVIGTALPKQKLIYTNWFHLDCLASYYKVEIFGEAHWRMIENFIQRAARHGMNMVLTPIFTPPLDTAIGGERPTVQLIDVEKTGDRYQFDFLKLQRWVDLCLRLGIQYFEFSQLFTQWGAQHSPKIIATVNGKSRKIFGWETDAFADEYRSFLDQFLPELIRFIDRNGLRHCSYFHISDEPRLEHLENYRKAHEMVSTHLADFPIIDALSDFDFYEKGYVKNPIPASDHIEPFLSHPVANLWTYYCCNQYKQVSNRFFSMPSQRNRILGYQLYKYNIVGFLHWGYNFWYTRYSTKEIDPFQVTDANYAFLSGDSFVVYPGKDGYPIDSLRLMVFKEALQDMRALQLLESVIGRTAVLDLLQEGLEQEITFSVYPRNIDWITHMRAQVNQKIKEALPRHYPELA